MKLVAALILVLASAPAVQAATQQVAVTVPATQILEGTTALSLTGPTLVRAHVVVKSNIPWTLVAQAVGGAGAEVRMPGGSWMPVTDAAPVLRGGRGVHAVTYEVRSRGALQGRLTLSLTGSGEAAP